MPNSTVTCLSNLVAEARDRVSPSELSHEPYIGLEHLAATERDVPEYGAAADVASQKAVFREGDVLYGRLRPYLRKVAVAPVDGVCSTDILVLRPKNGAVDPSFAYYVLASREVARHAIAMSAGTRMPRVSAKNLLSFELTLPEIRDQQRIAAAGTAIDDTRASARRALMAAQQLLTATLSHYFRDPPEDWSRVRLGEVATTRSGSTPKAGDDRYWLGGTVPFLKSADLCDGVVIKASGRVTPAAVKDYRLSIYRRGTVLIAMYGVTRGKVGLLDIEAAGNQAILAVSPDTSMLSSSFLFFALLAQQRALVRAGVGGAQQNLSGQVLREREIAFPSLTDQERLVPLFEAAASEAVYLRQLLSSLSETREALLAAALDGRLSRPSDCLGFAQ